MSTFPKTIFSTLIENLPTFFPPRLAAISASLAQNSAAYEHFLCSDKAPPTCDTKLPPQTTEEFHFFFHTYCFFNCSSHFHHLAPHRLFLRTRLYLTPYRPPNRQIFSPYLNPSGTYPDPHLL